MLEAFGLEQHIKFPTHQLGHTLHLIATEPATKFACTPIPGPYLLDHRMVIIENQQQETNRGTAIQRIHEINYSSNNRVPKKLQQSANPGCNKP